MSDDQVGLVLTQTRPVPACIPGCLSLATYQNGVVSVVVPHLLSNRSASYSALLTTQSPVATSKVQILPDARLGWRCMLLFSSKCCSYQLYTGKRFWHAGGPTYLGEPIWHALIRVGHSGICMQTLLVICVSHSGMQTLLGVHSGMQKHLLMLPYITGDQAGAQNI